jgi:hypothetical protein
MGAVPEGRGYNPTTREHSNLTLIRLADLDGRLPGIMRDMREAKQIAWWSCHGARNQIRWLYGTRRALVLDDFTGRTGKQTVQSAIQYGRLPVLRMLATFRFTPDATGRDKLSRANINPSSVQLANDYDHPDVAMWIENCLPRK